MYIQNFEPPLPADITLWPIKVERWPVLLMDLMNSIKTVNKVVQVLLDINYINLDVKSTKSDKTS